MKDKFSLKSPFFFSLGLFLLAVLIINPLGEFVINDDWLFSRQVLAFSLGMFKINSLIDPSFILQGLMGYGWISIFGFSHSGLRILTIVVTLGAAYGLYKLLKFYNASGLVIKISLLIFLFNPLVLTSAFSFMTENYFLLFYIWSLYFYLRYFRSQKILYLFFGSVFAGASILIRQVGILTFAAFLPFLINDLKDDKAALTKRISLFLFPLFVSLITFALWPKYPLEIQYSTAPFLASTIKSFAPLSVILQRWHLDLFSFSYLAYFLSPLLFVFPLKINTFKSKIVMLMSVIGLAYPIYKFDLFPIGSVFYLEGLHIKSFAHQNFSLFDNIPFKIFLALIISFSLCYLIYCFFRKGQIYLEKTNKFLLLNFILNLLILFVTNDFYDRYLLVPFIPLLILTVANVFELYEYKNSLVKFAPAIMTVLFVLITFSLQEDFFIKTRLGWQQAEILSKEYHLQTNIYLAGPYEKYQKAVKDDDFSGYNSKPTGDYQCYIYDYTVDTDSKILATLENFNNKIGAKIIENPRIYQGRKPADQPKIKNNLETLEETLEYPSLAYNIVGKRAYVGSFCPPNN